MVTSWDSAVDKNSEESSQQEVAGKKHKHKVYFSELLKASNSAFGKWEKK